MITCHKQIMDVSENISTQDEANRYNECICAHTVSNIAIGSLFVVITRQLSIGLDSMDYGTGLRRALLGQTATTMSLSF